MGYSAKIKIDSKRPKKDGTCMIFMQVIIDRKKVKIDLDISWPANKFKDNRCLKRYRDDADVDEYNVIIGNAEARANAIRKDYLIRGEHMPLESFLKEY